MEYQVHTLRTVLRSLPVRVRTVTNGRLHQVVQAYHCDFYLDPLQFEAFLAGFDAALNDHGSQMTSTHENSTKMTSQLQ